MEKKMTQTPDTFPYLFWAYNIIWIMLCLYVVYLGVRIARLEKKQKNKNQ